MIKKLLSRKIKINKQKFRSRKFYKKLIKRGLLFSLIAIIVSHFLVEKTTSDSLYSSIELIPNNKVALLLGTNKHVEGRLNLYYKFRIDAAVKLYKSGKIKYIIVSGDNSVKHYNEPEQMRDDLVKRGVPSSRIFLDYAGFRTLDSVVRSKEIFGQSKITIISQPFHNKRAVYIAKSKGINAIAYNARSVSRRYGLKVHIRELFARVKLMLDLYIINKKPKFLGDPISIP